MNRVHIAVTLALSYVDGAKAATKVVCTNSMRIRGKMRSSVPSAMQMGSLRVRYADTSTGSQCTELGCVLISAVSLSRSQSRLLGSLLLFLLDLGTFSIEFFATRTSLRHFNALF
eukprot:m.173471 g.173471  ORF g.173471 m.173471 type:complete len:115 (+) comp14849_c0_seq2:1704-2048(+)